MTPSITGRPDDDAPVVLVTGASRGIGAAVVHTLATRGTSVIATAPEGDWERLDALRTDSPAAVTVLPEDFLDPTAPSRVVTAALERFGRIDGLVSSAFLSVSGSAADVSDDDWARTLNVTLTSTMRLCREVAYETAKAGLLALMRSIAVDFGGAGVRCNYVSPGLISSERVTAWAEELPGRLETMATVIPAGRVGTPEEVAAVVNFLLSNEASYVNGSVVAVDGGALAGLPENAPLLRLEQESVR